MSTFLTKLFDFLSMDLTSLLPKLKPAEAPAKPPAVRPYTHAPRLPKEPSEPGALAISNLVRGKRVEIEIGPGRGVFVFERLATDPDLAILGFEIKRKWSTIVDDRLKAQGLGARARVISEDAKEALPRLGPNASVQTFFLHFPDPWWKKKHAKRLVMGDILLFEIHRLLAPGGELFVQTDVIDRAEQYAAQVSGFLVGEHPGFVTKGDAPGSANLVKNPYNAESPREKRAREDGLPVYRMRFAKT
jgi:tRNA (guanine-N7-)-methyltransferase